MELEYHRKCVNDAYNVACFAESRQRVLDRNTIRVFAGFIDEALRHEGFEKTAEMSKVRELSAILQDHYNFQRKDPTISSRIH